MWLPAIFLLLSVPHAHAFFRILCSNPVVVERADSIVSPGAVSGHVHQILGGNGFDFTQTYDTLRASTCSTCEVAADDSNYWTPTLFFRAQNDTFHPVSQEGGATIYYLQRYGTPNETLHAFPAVRTACEFLIGADATQGFRMLAGNPALRSFNASAPEQLAITHNCLDYGGTGAAGQWNYLPTHPCPNGVRTQVFFPSCWDGVNLDAPDHKSHMAYPSGVDSGTCPASHPVRLVSIFYEVIWDTAAWTGMWWTPSGAQQPFVLSNGDPLGYGFHGDFVNGWADGVLQGAVNQCTNLSGLVQDCPQLALRSDAETNNCVMPSRVPETIDGWLSALPGCNPVQSGPANAEPVTPCGATKTILPKADASFLKPVAGWTPVGCASDAGSARVLSQRWVPGGMTVEKCLAHCAAGGFGYAGLEYAQECWCGASVTANATAGVALACDMPCEGNSAEFCGGSLQLALYKMGGTPAPFPSAPLPTAQRPSSIPASAASSPATVVKPKASSPACAAPSARRRRNHRRHRVLEESLF